jgi:hypothetical protein
MLQKEQHITTQPMCVLSGLRLRQEQQELIDIYFIDGRNDMTDMFLGFAALIFIEQNKEFIHQARENKKEGYVWELDPGFVSKDALAIAFEGNGKRTVMWRQKKVVEVRLPLPKPKEMK